MSSQADQYAVIGNPIAHSKSPWIHRQFAAQTGQQLEYHAMLAETDAFQQSVDAFAAAGGKGLNVTVPFKQDAWRYADELSDRARLAEAVNTLSFSDGSCYGDNTDGVGLVRDLTANLNLQLNGKRILILGAGGAVRGVLGPLLQAGPADIIVANRTISRAQDLIPVFNDLGNIQASGLDGIPCQEAFDLIINGTAASLQGDVPAIASECINEQTDVYDMMYGASATPFMQWAIQLGAKQAFDGLGMLVEQAAESFYIWRQVRPQTQPVILSIREAMSAS